MEQTRKPRILVTYVEAGMGHIVSAQAISDALKDKYGNEMEIIDSHVLRDSDNPILPKYEQFLVESTQFYSKYPGWGDLQFASMHIIGSQNTLKFIHGVIFHKETNATIKEYAKFNPDVIVCTHYFLLHCAVLYKKKVNHDAVILAYCPDNNVHGWWDNRADAIYTNNPLATKQAYELRFRNGTVMETFYPTRSAVSESNESKETYRKKFGIPLDKFAVVVADGVYAKAKAEKVCLELMKSELPLTVCLLAGKNEQLKEKFEKLKATVKPNITLLVYEFLSDAPQLYAACDLFITKAGPNAVLDSVMMGTPVIIDYMGSPLERAAKKLFIDHMFCGYYIENPKKIRKQVEALSKDAPKMEELRKALTFFDKSKNGASEIADDIAEIVWNRKEWKSKRLQAQSEAITLYMEEKAEIAIALAQERAKEIAEENPKQAERIVARANELAQKYADIGEKEGRAVYTKKTSQYAAKAASSKQKKVIAEREQALEASNEENTPDEE